MVYNVDTSLIYIFALAMKQWFVYIFSLYILILTVIPCVDGQSNHIEVKGVHQTTNHHSDEADHCSPLCTCQCCATSIVFADKPCQSESLPQMAEIVSYFVSHYQSSTCNNIWQPPQLA
jgi:hypothetical protein